jgi:hypothetical protein
MGQKRNDGLSLVRWGDKASEMDLLSIDEVVDAFLNLSTPDNLSGKSYYAFTLQQDPVAYVP